MTNYENIEKKQPKTSYSFEKSTKRHNEIITEMTESNIALDNRLEKIVKSYDSTMQNYKQKIDSLKNESNEFVRTSDQTRPN